MAHWGGEVCRERRLGKALGQPSLSLAPKKPPAPARHPVLTAGMTRPCTKRTKGSICPGDLRGGCSRSWGHRPQSWGHCRPPRPRAHPTPGTEPKQTCLVRASGAKSSPELSRLVDFCLKILLGCKSQAGAWSQSKAAKLLCRVLGREPRRGAEPRSSLPTCSWEEWRRAPVPPVGHGSVTSESSPGGDGLLFGGTG